MLILSLNFFSCYLFWLQLILGNQLYTSQQARDLVACVKGDPLTLCQCARAWGQRCGARCRRHAIHMWREVAWIALQTHSLREKIEICRFIEVKLKILVLWKQGQGETNFECEVIFWEVLLLLASIYIKVDLNPDVLSLVWHLLYFCLPDYSQWIIVNILLCNPHHRACLSNSKGQNAKKWR